MELNRDESQKYLDQMKQDLASMSNNKLSTLPGGGYAQTFAGSSFQNQGNFGGVDIF